jgi:hypothetical protein
MKFKSDPPLIHLIIIDFFSVSSKINDFKKKTSIKVSVLNMGSDKIIY